MHRHLPLVRAAAVLEQVDPLPGPERQPSADQRDRQLGPGEGGAQMGRHVVRPLVVVGVEGGVLRRQAFEEGLKVRAENDKQVLAALNQLGKAKELADNARKVLAQRAAAASQANSNR